MEGGIGKNLAKGFSIDVTPEDSGGRLIKKLYDASAITLEQAKLIQKILQLANAGVHGTPVSSRDANQIITIAGFLVDQHIAWLSWRFDDEWHANYQR